MSNKARYTDLSGTLSARLGKYRTLELRMQNCSCNDVFNLTRIEADGLRDFLNSPSPAKTKKCCECVDGIIHYSVQGAPEDRPPVKCWLWL
jgi:hypothetical protein